MKTISFKGFISQKDIQKHKYDIEYLLDPIMDEYVSHILPLDIANAFQIRKLEWKDFIGKPNEESNWIAHCYWNLGYQYIINEEKTQTPLPLNQKLQKSPPPKERILPPLPPGAPPKKPQKQVMGSRGNSIPKVISSRNSSPTARQNESPLITRKLVRSGSSSSVTRSKSQNSQRSVFKLQAQVWVKFLEKSWAKRADDEFLLEHEIGHYLIGCLCALEFKRRAEQLQLKGNDAHEIKIKKLFQSVFRTFLQIERDYDDETNHYCNDAMQQSWNRKIKEQLLLYDQYFS